MQSIKRVRASAEDTKSKFLDKALVLAEEKGFNRFSCLDLANASDCGHSLVFHHFVNMRNLRIEVMRAAIERKNLKVLGQGLMSQDEIAVSAPHELKQKALKAITKI